MTLTMTLYSEPKSSMDPTALAMASPDVKMPANAKEGLVRIQSTTVKPLRRSSTKLNWVNPSEKME